MSYNRRNEIQNIWDIKIGVKEKVGKFTEVKILTFLFYQLM